MKVPMRRLGECFSYCARIRASKNWLLTRAKIGSDARAKLTAYMNNRVFIP
jgi:hypothetical protein